VKSCVGGVKKTGKGRGKGGRQKDENVSKILGEKGKTNKKKECCHSIENCRTKNAFGKTYHF